MTRQNKCDIWQLLTAPTYLKSHPVSDIQFVELLPDKDVMENLVSRVVSKYLPAIRSFRDVVVRHIPYEYSKEMSQKSNSVFVETFQIHVHVKLLLIYCITLFKVNFDNLLDTFIIIHFPD